MSAESPAARLHMDAALAEGARLQLPGLQAHHLTGVLRLKTDTPVNVFNGRDGEYRGRLVVIKKSAAMVTLERYLAPPEVPPDLWLLAPALKKERTDILAEKATELGVAAFWPITAARSTAAARLKPERLQRQLVEAAQQCERCTVPALFAAAELEALLADWPPERPLIVLSARGTAPALPDLLAREPIAGSAAHALLIGPEGGLTQPELDRLAAQPFVSWASLGPRILRAETAALAALTCFQASALGDWATPWAGAAAS